MRLSFTTLSCPDFSFEQVLDTAQRLGYDGIELRGIQDEMDNTRLPQLAPDRRQATLENMKNRGLTFCCLDTSVNFHESQRQTAFEQEARGNIALAQAVGAPYIRVFGDKLLPGETYPQAYRRVGKALAHLGDMAADSPVKVLLETHGEFASGKHIRAIMEQADHPAVGVLWDVHHPYKYAGESMAYTLDEIRPWMFHVHIKDSIGPWASHRLTLPGRGDLPLQEVIALLRQAGYEGYLSLEHELRWHRDIEPADEALEAYVRVMRQWLA